MTRLRNLLHRLFRRTGDDVLVTGTTVDGVSVTGCAMQVATPGWLRVKLWPHGDGREFGDPNEHGGKVWFAWRDIQRMEAMP